MFLTVLALLAAMIFLVMLAATYFIMRSKNTSTPASPLKQEVAQAASIKQDDLGLARPPFIAKLARELNTRALFGVACMALLMLAVPFAARLIFMPMPFAGYESQRAILVIGALNAGIIGFLAVRVAGLSWRHTVIAALLAGAGWLGLARLFSPLIPGPWEGNIQPHVLASFLFLYGAGVFLLPLFDPIVRQRGPAPRVWTLILAALGIVLLIFQPNFGAFYASNPMDPDLFILAASLLVGTGMLLTLAKRELVGAWMGALGVVMIPLYAICIVFVLASYGS